MCRPTDARLRTVNRDTGAVPTLAHTPKMTIAFSRGADVTVMGAADDVSGSGAPFGFICAPSRRCYLALGGDRITARQAMGLIARR